MSNRDRLSRLADEWIKYSKATIVGRKATDEEKLLVESLSWTHEAFRRLITKRSEVALEVILGIMKRTDDGDVLNNLAASPLEDLLSENRSSIIEAVEHLASRDPQFRTLLKGVWRLAMTNETWQRVKIASDR
jgi:hypothetical protein